MARDGKASLGRIVSLKPVDHQLSAEEMKQVLSHISDDEPGAPKTELETYEICDHPWVDIYGGCPTSAEAERRARAKGYRVRSVR